jgi:hypothetical protein
MIQEARVTGSSRTQAKTIVKHNYSARFSTRESFSDIGALIILSKLSMALNVQEQEMF